MLPALCATAAALDARALIGRLAKPAPATVAFREVRFSTLVNEPLIVAGELVYTDATSLDRRVTYPYQETVAIRGESVRVEREGSPPRSFGLNRAPELRGLLSGFTALLAGDSAALERNFSIAANGSDAAWTLELTPTDKRARRRMQQIGVLGAGTGTIGLATDADVGRFAGTRPDSAQCARPDALPAAQVELEQRNMVMHVRRSLHQTPSMRLFRRKIRYQGACDASRRAFSG